MTLSLEENPSAWLVPHLLDLEGKRVLFTRADGCQMSDDQLTEKVTGTVAWSAEVGFIDDGNYFVRDRYGIEHRPEPLFRKRVGLDSTAT
mgnify:CR=1 FL=1